MSAAASPTAASLPRITYVAPSLSGPGGAVAAPPATPAAPAQPAAHTPAATLPAKTGAKQASKGVSLLGRVMGLIPLAAGLAQAIAGFFITRGTISLAAVPILGSLPAFLVGGLVAATAMPSIMQGIGKIIGKP